MSAEGAESAASAGSRSGASSKPAEPAGPAGIALTVEAGGRRFAVPVGDVAEIVRPRPLARVPRAPASLLGVAELRGAVVAVLSLARLRDGGGEAAVGGATDAGNGAERLVVMARRPPVALLVDRVASLGPAADAVPLDFDALLARSFPSASRPPPAPAPDGAFQAEGRPRELDVRDERAILLFTVAGQLCGLPLADVAEVMRAPRGLVPVPGGPAGTIGVIERRGALLPVGSARSFLDRPDAEPGGPPGGGAVVVVRHGAWEAARGFGLAVDAVEGLARLPAERVVPVPAVLNRGAGKVEAIARLGDGRLATVLAARSFFVDGTADGDANGGTAVERDDAVGTDAVETEEAGDPADPGLFVVFQLGAEDYALPIAAVEEVVRRPSELARVPRAAAAVAGAMNLRGSVVPVIEAALRFGPSSAAPEPGPPSGGRRRVIVLRGGAARVGVAVDGVSEVLSVPPGAVQPAPDLARDAAGTFDRVIADRGRLILVVSPGALLSVAEPRAAPERSGPSERGDESERGSDGARRARPRGAPSP